MLRRSVVGGEPSRVGQVSHSWAEVPKPRGRCMEGEEEHSLAVGGSLGLGCRPGPGGRRGGGAAPPSLPLSHFLPFDLHLLECSFRSSSLAGACFAPFPPVRSSSLLCIPAASLKPVLSDDV